MSAESICSICGRDHISLHEKKFKLITHGNYTVGKHGCDFYCMGQLEANLGDLTGDICINVQFGEVEL